ncbi:MAG: prepilin-type N-terminal cleavage/methylation domain-containing protein, partial [Patescibacteria group bacterium]
MRRRAFTLIELLVVISIIGILVSISVVGWVSVAQRGRDSTRKSDLARIK